MTNTLLKAIVSSILVIGHFLILSIVGLMYTLSGFTFTELTTTIAILLPITSIYTSTVIKDIIQDREGGEGKTYSAYSISYSLISILLPLAFILYLIAIVILKSFNRGIENFDQFKTFLVTGETIFAAYVGQIVHSMFDAQAASPTPSEGVASKRSS
jgi:hypothetical protein